MPTLLSTNEIVDLKQTRSFNRNRKLSAGNMMELSSMPESELLKTMKFSLTKKQIVEVAQHMEESKNNPLMKMKLPQISAYFRPSQFIKESLSYPLVQPKKGRKRIAVYTANYDSVSKILYIENEPIVLSNSPNQATLCELIYNHRNHFKGLMSYQLIFGHGTFSEELRSKGIASKTQLRTAIYDLNKKVKLITKNESFLIGRDGIQRNPRFSLTTP